MVRFRNIVPALLLGSTLAACATGPNMKNPAWYSNRSYYPENQTVIQRTNFLLDVSTTSAGLPNSEAARLGDWFESLQLRYGDRIHVEDPAGNARVRADVAKVAAEYGLLVSEGAPVSAGSARPGTARVIVRRSTASMPTCPNWRQSGMSGGLESTESNFGCSINGNMAAMIANPEDLILGRDREPGGDAETTSKAVKAYREAPPTSSKTVQAVSTAGGK